MARLSPLGHHPRFTALSYLIPFDHMAPSDAPLSLQWLVSLTNSTEMRESKYPEPS